MRKGTSNSMADKKQTFDVIVVGSGASGGWACKRLAEAGLKVALLEAGAPQSFKNFTEHKPLFDLKYRDLNRSMIKKTRPIQTGFDICTEYNYEWFANDLDERERIVRDLCEHKCLILKHHGLLTAGVSIGEAFNLMYYLEKRCETQMMVLASNQPYSLPSEASCEKSAQIFWGNGRVHDRDWPALMQLAESIDPSFRN